MEYKGYDLKPEQNTSKVCISDLFKGAPFIGIEHGIDSNEQVVNLSDVIAFESAYAHVMDDMYEWQVIIYFRSNPRLITLHLSHYGYDVFLLKLHEANCKKDK